MGETRMWSDSKWLFGVVLVAAALASGVVASRVAAQAAETTVVQKDIAFVPERIVVKAGSTVVFVNDDRFGHNVYSETPGADFDIGRQPPGQRTSVVFRRAGNFEVRCRIHPKMRLEVAVSA
jgi:plastocyanin